MLGAPVLTLGILSATFLTALPLGIALQGELARHLGSSLEAERAESAWNSIWAGEFRLAGVPDRRARSRTRSSDSAERSPALSGFVDAESLDPTIAAVVAGYVGLWVFLSGGILDRLARGRPVRPFAFFAACGAYFVRFVRLAVVIGPCYWLLFAKLHPWLFGTLYDRCTRDLDAEQQVVAVRVALYLVFVSLLVAVNLVADFAKVRAVVEDRRSAISALGAALRFIRRRPARVLGLYLLNILAAAVVSAPLAADGAGSSRAHVARPAGRTALHPGSRLGEAGLHGVRGGVLPGRAGAREFHGGAGARLAGFAGGRSDQELAEIVRRCDRFDGYDGSKEPTDARQLL